MKRHAWLSRQIMLAYRAPIDPDRARKLRTDACNKGSAEGCGALADLYVLGRGVPRDIPHGLRLYEDACKRGDGLSCQSLGATHSGGP